MTDPSSAHRVRLGDFHLDLDSGELVKDGVRMRLQVQSLELLKALLERPGKMVGREELRQRLWPNDTFVDFDHGLNAAVRRLREALGDSAEAPRFVETIPRRGYRLVAETSGATPPSLALPLDRPNDRPAGIPTGRAPGIQAARVLGPTAVLLLIVAAAAWLAHARADPESRRPLVTLSLDVPAGWEMGPWDSVALSPDGRQLAFTASGSDRQRALWLRPLAESAGRLVPRTAGAFGPFWSPDSTKVGFFVQDNLNVVNVADGTLHSITRLETPQLTSGAATWMANGDILMAPVGTTSGSILRSPGVYRLRAQTGRLEPLPSFATQDQLAFLLPVAVPGHDRFTFLTLNTGTYDLIGHTGTVSPAQGVTDIGPTDSRVVATSSGHIVFVRNGALVAQRFDAGGQIAARQPTILARDISVELPTLGSFSASSDVMVYLTRAMVPADMQMTLFDRSGAVIGAIGDRGVYSSLAVSPDGTRMAVSRRKGPTGTRDIWIYDLAGKPPVRLTFDPHDDLAPEWSADGTTILFSSDRAGERDIYQKAANGQRPETLVFSSSESKSLNAWSPDGRVLIYDTGARGRRDSQGRSNPADLFTVTLEGTPRVRPLATSPAHEGTGDISPDGTLVAYQSSEAGEPEVFVETFPDKAGRWQVTTGGGREPVWAADGRELFYISPVDEMCAVDVRRSGSEVGFGSQRVLFKIDGLAYTTRKFAPLPRRRGFVVLITKRRNTPQQMTVLVNWRSALPE